MNVLITNVGRRGYLVEYLKANMKYNVRVFVSDCDKTASGLYTCNDGHFVLPRPVDDPEHYVNTLIRTCLENDIYVIIPVIDPEITILGEYLPRFEQNGIFVSVSQKRVLDICYNKLCMNEFLRNHDFFVPKTFVCLEELSKAVACGEVTFPVIIKPIYGSGSVSTYKVDCMNEAKALFREGHMIQEFVDGQEYGTDVFNDASNIPVRCVLKKKISMRSGETDKALTVKLPSVQAKVIRLAQALGHRGNLDCDLIVREGRVYFIDLNPRFGGGYPATHAAGVDLLELVLDMSQHERIVPNFEDYEDNLLVMKTVSVKTIKADMI